LLIATIVAFFGLAALLVRALGRVVADTDADEVAGGPPDWDTDPGTDPDAGAPDAAARSAELEPGRPA
jgi:hypothetical protein